VCCELTLLPLQKRRKRHNSRRLHGQDSDTPDSADETPTDEDKDLEDESDEPTNKKAKTEKKTPKKQVAGSDADSADETAIFSFKPNEKISIVDNYGTAMGHGFIHFIYICIHVFAFMCTFI